MTTELFFGYDPGGRKEVNNGVVVAHISERGTVSGLDSCRLRDARGVIAWFGEKISKNGSPVAIGIDTMLGWSYRGVRVCDLALERHHGFTVIKQNALRCAMAVNGVLVAKEFPSMPLVESHPKLLKRVLNKRGKDDPERAAFEAAIAVLLKRKWPGEKHDPWERRKDDHEEDALIAAWCASRWHYQRWTTDIYDIPEPNNEKLHFPAGPAVYPWPEPVPPAPPAK